MAKKYCAAIYLHARSQFLLRFCDASFPLRLIRSLPVYFIHSLLQLTSDKEWKFISGFSVHDFPLEPIDLRNRAMLQRVTREILRVNNYSLINYSLQEATKICQ